MLFRSILQPGEMHGHSSEAEITTCRNIVSYTATLPRLSFQSAEMLVSCTATFRGGNYNLPKCYQLHSHSSEAVITTCQNVVRCTATLPRFFLAVITTCQNIVSYTATLPRFFLVVITTCQNVGQLHSHSPLAHHPTVGQLVVT